MTHLSDFALLFLAAYAFAMAFSGTGTGAYELAYAWDDNGMEDM